MHLTLGRRVYTRKQEPVPLLGRAYPVPLEFAAPGGLAIKFSVQVNGERLEEIETDQPVVVVGRSPECDLVVDHRFVSKQHLRILAGRAVEDMDSSNGTFLDGVRILGARWWGKQTLTVGGPEVEVLAEGRGSDDATSSASNAVPPKSSCEGGGVEELLKQLIQDDFQAGEPLLEGRVGDFYALESFRLVRQLEKVVTRLAGEFIQRAGAETMLPNSEDNFRKLIGRVLDHPDETQPREELLEYFNAIRRWLFVSLGAYKQASVKFADEVQQALATHSLTRERPIPFSYKWLGMSEVILYRRTREYLQEMSPEFVRDRLDELGREAALELLGPQGFD